MGPTLLTQHRSPITKPPGLRPEGQMTVPRNIKQLTLLFQRSGRIHQRRIAPAMNILSRDKQIDIIAALTEGVGVRATARLVGVNRETVGKLALQVGKGCAELHDRRVVGVRTGRLELDELWQFVGKKQKRAKAHEIEKGDQWTFIALASTSRAIVAYRTGKRTTHTTDQFVQDLRQRVLGAPEISTDGFKDYRPAIRDAFRNSAHGIIIKTISVVDLRQDAAHRYSPAQVVAVSR
jgi:IS1 family transposase